MENILLVRSPKVDKKAGKDHKAYFILAAAILSGWVLLDIGGGGGVAQSKVAAAGPLPGALSAGGMRDSLAARQALSNGSMYSIRRPHKPSFSELSRTLLAAGEQLPPEVQEAIAEEPALKEVWEEFQNNPEQPAEEFLAKVTGMPEFRQLVAQFRSEPGFRGVFNQLASRPDVATALRAALRSGQGPLSASGSRGGLRSGSAGSGGRRAIGAGAGGSAGSGSSPVALGGSALHSAHTPQLATVPPVGEAREVKAPGVPADTVPPGINPDLPVPIIGPGALAALQDAISEPEGSSSSSTQDVSSVTTNEQTTTEQKKDDKPAEGSGSSWFQTALGIVGGAAGAGVAIVTLNPGSIGSAIEIGSNLGKGAAKGIESAVESVGNWFGF